MRHPDPHGPPDLTPIVVGEVWENPLTGERATILELAWQNPAGRVTVELTALVGARVVGEHRHPALVERFTVLEGELTRFDQAGVGLSLPRLDQFSQTRRLQLDIRIEHEDVRRRG